MLNLIRSNKIELITEVLAKELLINPPSVTEQINISVDDYLLSKWMRDEITIKNKISALYDFKTINSFTENIIRHIYPDNNFVNWDHDLLLWNIINSLEELSSYEESWPLKSWLSKFNKENKYVDKDIYILCNNIAHIFSEYMIFRPEMINNWHELELGKEEIFKGVNFNDYWQPVLFKLIERRIGSKSLPYLIIKLIKDIEYRKIKISDMLPNQIYIVAINNLSKLQMNFYLKISQFTRVNIYQLSYGFELWNRINIDERVNLKNEKQGFEIENVEKIFGKYGADFDKLFEETSNTSQIEINFKPFYLNPEIDDELGKISLLHQIQKKIINNNGNKFNIIDNDESFYLSGHDDIIQQMEYVRDKIFQLIEINKKIKFSDIAITSPNLDNAIPYIKSIFDDEYINGQKLPYLLLEKEYFQISNIFRIIIDYFDLAISKLTIQKLSSFLNDICFREIFDFNSRDIEETIKILSECGFDWGLDASERAGEYMNSLDWCLERITLGMVYDDKFFINNNISSHISDNNYLDLHKSINILNQLKNNINSLRGVYTLRDWVDKIKSAIPSPMMVFIWSGIAPSKICCAISGSVF